MRYYLVMLQKKVQVCERIADAEILGSEARRPRVKCDAGWRGCTGQEGHAEREVLAWYPFCAHGAVVSLYDAPGKARTKITVLRNEGYHKDIVDMRVHFFDLDDTFWLDDPAPMSQRIEARSLRDMDKFAAEERAEAEALALPQKKRRKRAA